MFNSMLDLSLYMMDAMDSKPDNVGVYRAFVSHISYKRKSKRSRRKWR